MSVKDDNVLDNWEEIDETELNSKLAQLKKESNLKMHTNNINGPMKIIMLNDGMSSQYSSPEPSVKILRRPTQNNDDKTNLDKPKAPKKTLQQREQEYAEARLRILGSAKSPDEEKVDPNLGNINKPENGVVIATSSTRPQINLLTNGFLPNVSENIIRQPKGPDGTIGFKMRR